MSFTQSEMYPTPMETELNTFDMSEIDEVSNYMMHGCKINPRRQLQIIANCARKVLLPGQVAIVCYMPHTILWVTNNSQTEVGSSAADADEIADALENKLPREASEKVGHRIIRTAEQAVLGIQSRTSFEMRTDDKNVKVGFDFYQDEPDFLTIVAFLTPIKDQFNYPNYDQAQLSSLRYLVGVIMSGHDDMHILAATLESIENSRDYERYIRSLVADGRRTNYAPSTASTDIVTPADTFGSDERESAPNPNIPHMYDFIPSMTFREIDYFYSMILGTAIGTYRRHETELQNSESIDEQEKQSIDPDDMDPNERMRFMQSKAISPCFQRRPRDPAEIRAELEEQRLKSLSEGQALMAAQPTGRSNNASMKNVGIKCLECGADSSPEWRKGPKGPKTLCNRCGLRYAKFLKSQK